MKDLAVLILEDSGMVMGAGIGALGSTGIWAMKRLQLRKKMQLCNGNPSCIAQVQQEIKSLRNKSIVRGAVFTGGGAIAGGMSSGSGGRKGDLFSMGTPHYTVLGS